MSQWSSLHLIDASTGVQGCGLVALHFTWSDLTDDGASAFAQHLCNQPKLRQGWTGTDMAKLASGNTGEALGEGHGRKGLGRLHCKQKSIEEFWRVGECRYIAKLRKVRKWIARVIFHHLTRDLERKQQLCLSTTAQGALAHQQQGSRCARLGVKEVQVFLENGGY